MNYWCHAREIAPGIHGLRVYPAGVPFGEPYVWCACAVEKAEGVVELELVMKAPTPEMRKAIRETLQSIGYFKVIIRRGDGSVEVSR